MALLAEEEWVSASSIAAPHQVINSLSRKITPIMCTLINNLQGSLKLSDHQETTTTYEHESTDDPTTPTLLLGEGAEYIKGSEEEDGRPDDEEVQCVICLYNVMKGEKYRVVGDCKHRFHADCIDAWLENNSSCPLCRSPIPYAASGKQPELNREREQALRDLMLSCVITFLEHFWTWFVNPLGFDTACEDQHQDHQHYLTTI